MLSSTKFTRGLSGCLKVNFSVDGLLILFPQAVSDHIRFCEE
jgi:hypothetical protein